MITNNSMAMISALLLISCCQFRFGGCAASVTAGASVFAESMFVADAMAFAVAASVSVKTAGESLEVDEGIVAEIMGLFVAS